MAALEVIRATYDAGKRKLPTSPPLRFVPRRWRPFVVGRGGVDRAAYELCAFSELRERLRAGDVWVAGSRRYRAFDDYLLPRPTFEALKAAGPLPLAVAPRFEDHLAERRCPARGGGRSGGGPRQGRRVARRAPGRGGADDHALARDDAARGQGRQTGTLRPAAAHPDHRGAPRCRCLDRLLRLLHTQADRPCLRRPRGTAHLRAGRRHQSRAHPHVGDLPRRIPAPARACPRLARERSRLRGSARAPHRRAPRAAAVRSSGATAPRRVPTGSTSSPAARERRSPTSTRVTATSRASRSTPTSPTSTVRSTPR